MLDIIKSVYRDTKFNPVAIHRARPAYQTPSRPNLFDKATRLATVENHQVFLMRGHKHPFRFEFINAKLDVSHTGLVNFLLSYDHDIGWRARAVAFDYQHILDGGRSLTGDIGTKQDDASFSGKILFILFNFRVQNDWCFVCEIINDYPDLPVLVMKDFRIGQRWESDAKRHNQCDHDGATP